MQYIRHLIIQTLLPLALLQASSITEFGAAWRNDMTCETEGVTENPCVMDSLEENWSKDMCNLLIQISGKHLSSVHVVYRM